MSACLSTKDKNISVSSAPSDVPHIISTPSSVQSLSSSDSHIDLAAQDFCSAETSDYLLDKNDEITVTVFGEDTLSGDFTVDPTGMVTLPLIGRVGVKGCSIEQTRQIISDQYENGYLLHPNLSVEVKALAPIFIIGEVRTPGRFEFETGMTVLKATALAGGFTYRANQKSIKVLRKANDGSAKRVELSPEAVVKPGDILTVKERLF